MLVLRLAIPSPLRRLFDYLPPAGLSHEQAQQLVPGVRIEVPFGRRNTCGILIETSDDAAVASEQLRPALEVLDSESVLAPDMMALCQWAASYYQHPIGEVLSAALPQHLRQGRPREAGDKAWRLTSRGLGLPADALGRSPRQQQALVRLLASSAPIAASTLKEDGLSTGALRELEKKDLAERCFFAPAARPATARDGLALNPEQARVVEAITGTRDRFTCHLLEGVTGSGKTEVYLQLIADCLARGRQALVLVPEIGLGPQTLNRFRARFDADIVTLHSGMADGERYRAWEAASSGRAHIVIGTRSAIFCPLPRPGIVVVDEEHDASYRQQDSFRYSARDLAVKRAQLLDCPVLLGSATPSLESVHNADQGRYSRHRLTQRAGQARLPSLQTVDVRRLPLEAGFSEPLVQAIDTTLTQGQQALLFLNRRGYAPSLQCHDCGWVAECRHCDARLTVHLRRRQLRCHHCGAGQRLPTACPDCHGSQLITTGVGTEQAEQFLQTRFGSFPIHRVDSDSMRSRHAMEALAEEVNRGEPAILLGTQMLTKGHHFPAVTLVAVIDTDALLFSADFRGEERMAQLLVQVAGRAGRADAPGRVLLQTHHPDHPAIQAALKQNYAEQAGQLLQQRRSACLPPWGQLLMVRADCSDATTAEQFLQQLRSAFNRQNPGGCQLIGPLPSPMPRRKGRYRYQLIVTTAERRDARVAATTLTALAEAQPRRNGLNWFVDIDPTEM